MKIVLITHHTLSKNAGAAGIVMSLASEFQALGHEVVFISHDSLRHTSKRLLSIIFPFYCAIILWLRHRDADVIDASSSSGWLYFRTARQAKRALHVGHSYGLAHIIHDNLMAEVKAGKKAISWKYPLFNGSVLLWQDAETFRAADLAIFMNQYDKNYAVERLHVDASKSRALLSGLSEAFLSAARRVSVRPRGRRTRIVQVGSYIERKGTATTVAALSSLMRERADIEITFLGTCRPESETLADFPVNLRSRVHVVSFFENECLPELLSRQDIFVMPSSSEGFGLAPLEAMACGLVPIVTNIPGPTEYIRQKENGLLVPVGDSESLSSAILELMENDSLYYDLQAQAIKTAFAMRWSEIASARIDLYRDVIRAKKTSQSPIRVAETTASRN